MKEPNELFKSLLGEASESWLRNVDEGGFYAKEAAKKLFWFKIGIYLFLGAAALKVIFRTNFGVNAISLLQIGLASIILGLWALICLVFAFFNFGLDNIYYDGIFGGNIGLIITSFFYFTLSFYLFYIGNRERKLSKSNSKNIDAFYRGDSVLLSGLLTKGWSQKTIHERAEPFLAFSISIFLMALNPLLGIPIFLCSISLVLNQIYENIFQMGESQIKKILKTLENDKEEVSSVK